MMERYGLRVSLLSGFASQVTMIALSVLGCSLVDAHAAYWTVWAGQVIGSFGQPLFLNNVVCHPSMPLPHPLARLSFALAQTRLAGDWFPMNERDLAVTLSVVARSLGVMGISIAAPLVVQQPDQVALLYNWQLPIWLLIFGSSLWLCRDRPRNAPSAAAFACWAAEDAARAAPLPPGTSRDAHALRESGEQVLGLARLPNFVWLALSFSLLTGIGWTFLTVVGQLLEPCGYSSLVAGAANAVFMGANALGCLAAAPVVESTRAYLALQRTFSWLTFATVLAVLGTARAGQTGAVLAAWAALGFTMGPLTPVSFEHAVEMTFPLPAQASNAILNIVSNLVGFLQTVGITPLLAHGPSATCSSVATPAAAFTLACTAVGLATVQLIRRDYRRMAAEGTVAGDPWEYGAETGFDAKLRPDALPGTPPAGDGEKTPLMFR